MIHLGKEEQSPTVVGVEVRTAPLTSEPWVRTYGVIDGGVEVMRAAWPKLDHVFSVRRSDGEREEDESPKPKNVLREPHRLPKNLLTDFPVDLLTVEQGHATKPPLDYERRPWEKMISQTNTANQPRVVLEAWPPNSQLWTKGPTCKSTLTRWQNMEYVSRYKHIAATDVGGLSISPDS
jgi:hypothetical protein